ncbi:MAG: glycosyl hydrolase family 32 [Candidatus Bipolaricaulaceae bacterium]
MFMPEDRYLWDFWLLRWEGEYHLFYLQAPRSLADPELRHGNASVGHAVSRDLTRWQDAGTALEPGPGGAWDDRAIWTGSVIDWRGRFYMLYTGTCLEEEGKVQRIGLATSRDLLRWEKHPANPVLEANPRWYEGEGVSPFGERAWRDPYVIHVPGEGCFCAFITARAAHGPVDGRGCIGVARSADLVRWEVLPPLAAPRGFAQMEVPQHLRLQGRHYLLFSAAGPWVVGAGLPRATGTFYAVSSGPWGPYRFGGLLLGGEEPARYAAKLVTDPQGELVALSWLGRGGDGTFVGGLSDPVPVRVLSDGALQVV